MSRSAEYKLSLRDKFGGGGRQCLPPILADADDAQPAHGATRNGSTRWVICGFLFWGEAARQVCWLGASPKCRRSSPCCRSPEERRTRCCPRYPAASAG